MDKKKILSNYESEEIDKTIRNGKISVILGIPAILYFVFQDIYIVEIPTLLFARLIFIIPFCFLCSLYFSH